jgi:hypothetical protein
LVAATWVGLLDIGGVMVLASGEISHLVAFARYARGDASQKTSWDQWARPLIRVSAMVGSKEPEAMGDAGPLEGMATRLLGYTMIFLGFVLQTMGALAALR